MAQDFAVNVEGLAEFRRDLRRLDHEAGDEVRETLEHGAEIVAVQAALLAPRRTGALAASYRAYTRGNRVGVRSPLPYAGVIEFGGTISPRGTPFLIQRSAPVRRAALRQADAMVHELERGIERAARQTGWH